MISSSGAARLSRRKRWPGGESHFVVCSRGESGTNGTPEERVAEAQRGAAILGATIEFLELDGDAQLERRAVHAMKLAAIIRRILPSVILAPTPCPNQHPDHAKLADLVRDAARLARYGGVEALRGTPPHSIAHLLFYAITPNAEPAGERPILLNVSGPAIQSTWAAAMSAHETQMRTRNYIELQLARAR